MVISSLEKRVRSPSASGERGEGLFVRQNQNTIEEDCASIANESVDPKQPDTTQGETTKESGGDIA